MGDSKQTLSWIDEAISVWIAGGIKLQNGVSITKISEIEKTIEFKFPNDFIELYKKANGFEDFDWNKYMFSLWSLDRILIEYKEDDDKNYIGFCDYLINSHSIGFLKTDKGIFKSYNQTKLIANTFEETIALINSNSDLLY